MKSSQIDKRLVTILLIVFVQMVGAAMILPILPLYAQSQFGLEPQYITLLNTSFFGAQFLAAPYLGSLSDRMGRVPVLIVSQIGTVISFLMFGLAQGSELLFAARILDGITGGNIIVARAYITDVTPREKRTESLGYIFAVFGLGYVIGPALGGVLSAAFGARMPYFIAAGAALIVVLLTVLILEEPLSLEQREKSRAVRRQSLSLRQIATNPQLVLILTVTFLVQFGLGLLQPTLALYGEAVIFRGYSPQAIAIGIGLLLATFGMTQLLTQALLLRRALRRFGEGKLILIGNVLRVLASFGYALARSPLLGGFSSVFYALGIGVMIPSLQSMATTTVGDEIRGGVLGVYQSAISLSIIFSSAIAGVLYAQNPTWPFWVGGLLGLAALLPSFLIARQSEPVTRPVSSHQI